jgi:hypothetical protein
MSRMKSEADLEPIETIESLIRTIRGQKVILDRDLARIFGVPTFRFNEAIKRNRQRFPADFMFQLTKEETAVLTSQTAMSKPGRGGRRTLAFAFTENGAVMSANILNSPQAVRVSVFVVRAFVKMREMLAGSRELATQLTDLERKLAGRLDIHELAIVDVLQRIMRLLAPPPEPGPTNHHSRKSASTSKKAACLIGCDSSVGERNLADDRRPLALDSRRSTLDSRSGVSVVIDPMGFEHLQQLHQPIRM